MKPLALWLVRLAKLMVDNKTPSEAIPLPVADPQIQIEELPEDQWSSPLGEAASPLDSDEPGVRLEPELAANVADIFTMAGIGVINNAVSVSDVLSEFGPNARLGSTEIGNIAAAIADEDSDVQKRIIHAAISNPQVDVEQRIELARAITEGPSYDLNSVQRQAMHNANMIENSGDTPEEVEDMERGAEVAEGMSNDVEVDTPLPASQEEYRSYYEQMLNEAYDGVSETSLLSSDFFGTLIPFRYEAPVMAIYDKLGLNRDAVSSGSGLLLGEALRQMREHVESLDENGKQEALDTMLSVLRPNRGVMADGNDFVTAHVLEQVFYKDLFKTPYDGDINQQIKTQEAAIKQFRERGDTIAAMQAEQALQGLKDAAAGKVRAAPSGNQILDNFGSILDLIGLGSLAKASIKLGSKWMPKSLQKLRKVAPDLATKTAVDALENEAVRLKFPHLKSEDVVAAGLPSAAPALQEGGMEVFGEMISRQLDIKDRLLRIAERSNMTAAERADAFAEIQKIYGDVAAKPTSTLHLNESVIRNNAAQTGVEIEAIFGRTKTKPFSSYAQAAWAARNQIEEVFGADAAVTVVMRDPKTGKLIDVPKGVAPFTKGEFFLKAKDERAYESAPTAYHSLVLGDKDVANLRFAPSIWKHLRGVTNLMSKDVADNLRLASRQRTEWNKLVAGLNTDVHSLGRSDAQKLARILKQGEEVSTITGKGKLYTPSELNAMGLSVPGQRAYYAYRTATDIMYEVANRHTRTRMLREGMKDIHGPKGRVGFAQPRRLVDAQGDIGERATKLHAWDAVNGKFVELDRTGLEKLYKQGGQVARLEQPMLGKGASEATHVIMPPKGGVKALELPRQVMTKVEGYYPHMWNGNYVVYGMTKAGNRYALGLASNEADAKAVRDRMLKVNARRKAAGKPVRFEEINYDFDRQLRQDLAARGKVQEDVYVNMGGPVYGHRNGGSLRNFSKASGDIMVDPIEAMMRGMEIVGSKVTKGELATYMRQKLYQYARQEGILKDFKVVPSSVDDLLLTAGKKEAYEKAKAYLESIDMMLNIRDGVDELVSNFFLNASAVVSRYFGHTEAGRALSGKLATRAARGGDPMSALMGLMHRTTIATSPLGQGALQASQSLMMLGVSPINYLRAVRQSGVVSMLIGMRTSALHGGKLVGLPKEDFMNEVGIIAKSAGMSTDEVVKVVDTLLDSGLVSAVGYHTQMRNAIRSAAEERMLKNARGLNRPITGQLGRVGRAADAAVFGSLSKGFEWGEALNQITTFLTLYNRDKAKGVANLSDPDYVRKLVGSTSELTGDMIPETSFQYQRGWFKAAMQFVNFQHKMVLLMLPQAIGGAKSLTAGEKAGMVFTQFLLFGRRGAAHMDAFYRIMDDKIREQASEENGEQDAMYQAWNDPTTKAVMDGLIFDTAGNYVLKELFGDVPDFALAERFAPGGGSEFIADRLFAVASNPTQAIFGLAGEKTSKLYSWIRRTGDITLANIREHDDVPLDERFEELAKEGGMNLFSVYNRYLASKAAERMDGWVSSGGTITEGHSGALEHHLYTQFGIMTKDRESLYAAMDKYREETLTNPLARTEALDDLVDRYYKELVMTGIKFNSEATSDDAWNQMMDKWVRQRGLLFSLLDEPDAEYINEKVAERIERAMASQQDSAETILIERLTKDIRDGRFGSDGPDAALYLEQAEFVRNNPKLYEMVRQAWNEANTDDYLESK